MMELRRRYQSLYIPSDFFGAVFTWVDAFPLQRPFQFGNYCNFHIMHKEVDPLVKNTAVLDPPDANHTYSAKVGPAAVLTSGRQCVLLGVCSPHAYPLPDMVKNRIAIIRYRYCDMIRD